MAEWLVALFLLALCVALGVVAAMVCRMLGVSLFFARLLGKPEEKQVLTRGGDSPQDYMVTAESEVTMVTSSKSPAEEKLSLDIPSHTSTVLTHLQDVPGHTPGDPPGVPLKQDGPLSPGPGDMECHSPIEQYDYSDHPPELPQCFQMPTLEPSFQILPPEQSFKRLSPEQSFQILPPEQSFKRLSPEQSFPILSLEQSFQRLSPERGFQPPEVLGHQEPSFTNSPIEAPTSFLDSPHARLVPDSPTAECAFGLDLHTDMPEPEETELEQGISLADVPPDLQCSRLARAVSCDSVASDCSTLEWEPEVARIGQLEFGLEYDGETRELVVMVIQARGLELDPISGSLDSFVKVWLNPYNPRPQQTRTQRDSLAPVYKERLLFALPYEVADQSQVQFQVYSSDRYARHKLQGETELRLGDVDLRTPFRVWLNLRDIDQRPTELGDVMFSLSYLPTAERLTVVIVKARNLRWSDGSRGEGGDCFVKVYLLQNGRKVNKKKTQVKRDAADPIFNEAMIFSVPTHTLGSVQLRITVSEQHADVRTTSLGHVVIGSTVTGTELTHWNQMMTSLRKPIAMWHRLQK